MAKMGRPGMTDAKLGKELCIAQHDALALDHADRALADQ